ncbi:MAG: type III-B CRISPR module RAMP protein Cmr4 [Ardenticatenales bacterium]|nr:type III-B CRISPR module RAMP protein Cmr4 [Ardenticatenales bacterium]
MTSLLTLQYTLTETHVGGAGAVGAVDLPIVREATTGLPFLPDTALKGVARDAGDRVKNEDLVNRLFGPTGEGTELHAGSLVFTQGHLLAYPLRSLQRPYVYATCSLLLSRLDRLARAFGITLSNAKAWQGLLADDAAVRVGTAFAPKALLLESCPFGSLRPDAAVDALGDVLRGWMPADEGETGGRVKADLVVVPDADFTALVGSAAPVRARIRLDPETGTTSGTSGNLWYEEMLPTDCLFWSLISERDERQNGKAVHDFQTLLMPSLRHTQIGGGMTTGHGRIWWWPVVGARA